jgi:hypothetical protein
MQRVCAATNYMLDVCGRHELYAGYKGQRPPMPEEIGAALPKLVELLELMHIPTFQVPVTYIGSYLAMPYDDGRDPQSRNS